MKYFTAVGSRQEIESVIVLPPFRMLCSYHYFKKQRDLVKEMVDRHYEVFIDSGAFSAETKGVVINIDDYCEFIKYTGATTYASLDVIGDAKQTRYNTEYMIKEHGLKPLPTFHMGSTIEDLEALMNVYPYICLGGLVFSPKIVAHCDRVWHYILTHQPNLRVHGFGLTNIELMKRYPWYSVDSSSYKSCRRYGRQNVLWDGMDFKTIQEDEYLQILEGMGYKIYDHNNLDEKGQPTMLVTNAERYHLYDLHSSQSYKLFAAHLEEVNKHKDFSYLNAQQVLF